MSAKKELRTKALKIVNDILTNLNGRSGIEMDSWDDGIFDEMVEELVAETIQTLSEE